jgi:hypothetical protein
LAQDKQTNPPTLSDVLANQKRDILNDMNCVNVGVIQAFNAVKNTVSAKFAIKRLAIIKEDGTRIYEEKPVLIECPIIDMYGGAGGLTMPIAAGDECLILFNDCEIDNWWLSGGTQPPTTSRAHDISDAFAIVGVRSIGNVIADRLADGVRLFYAESRIDVLANKIESFADAWEHNGTMQINGTTVLNGDCKGLGGSAIAITADLVQTTGKSISVGNGASGTFNTVTVVNGIVVGGS